MDRCLQQFVGIGAIYSSWKNYIYILAKTFIFLNPLIFIYGCDSSVDTSPPWNSDDIPEYFTIDDSDFDYPGTHTYDGIVNLTGRVFDESNFNGQFGCIVDGHLPPSSGVTVTWLNTANGATESNAAYWTTTSFGVCGVVWDAENIPLAYGENEIILTALGITGRTAELRITTTRVPYKPLDLTRVVCNGEITLYWLNYLGGASSFNLYYSTNPYIASGYKIYENRDDVIRIENVNPPYVLSGLDPNFSYFFVLAGVTQDGILGYPSNESSANLLDCSGIAPSATEEDFIWELPGNSYIDLDTGTISLEYNAVADLFWDAEESAIRPVNSALLKTYNTGTNYKYLTKDHFGGTLGYGDYSYYFYDTIKPFDFDRCYGICLRDAFSVYTTRTNFSKLQILEYKPEELANGTSDYLIFRYYTYQF